MAFDMCSILKNLFRKIYDLVKHNYSIDWPKSKHQPSSAAINRWVQHYRGIYILNILCNTAFGKILIPFMKTAVILGFILCFFGCVRLLEYLNVVACAYLVFLLAACLLLLIPITLAMTSLYFKSQNFSHYVFPRLITFEKVEQRRLLAMLKSCPLIRCQVGSLYHMEANAQLTMVHNVVNGIAFLLVNV